MNIKKLIPFFLMVIGPGARSQTEYGIAGTNAIFITNNTSSLVNNTLLSPAAGAYTITRIPSGQVLIGVAEDGAGTAYALGYDSAAAIIELYTIAGSGQRMWAVPVSGVRNSLNLGNVTNVVMEFFPANDNEIRITDRNTNTYRINARTGMLVSSGTTGLSYGSELRTGTGNADVAAYTVGLHGMKEAPDNFYPTDIVNTDDLLMYPNPASSTTHVVLGNPSIGNVRVQVVDMNGSVLRHYSYGPQSKSLEVDLTNMPPGIYSVRVSGKGMAYHVLRVVKS